MYKFVLAIRYFLRRRITLLAMAAVALSVFIVVVVMSVMNGLVSDFKVKNHSFFGDCIIGTESLVGFAYYEDFYKQLEEQDFVLAASAVVRSFGLFTQTGADWNSGVQIVGVEPEKHSITTSFGQSLYYHKNDPKNAFVPEGNEDAQGCILGIEIPELGMNRDRKGQYCHSDSPPQFQLIMRCFPLTAKGALASRGTDFVNSRTYYYSDDSRSGVVKVDSNTIYLSLDQAQQMCGMAGNIDVKRISEITVKFAKGVNIDQGCQKVRQLWKQYAADRQGQPYSNLLENVRIQGWAEYRRGTIAAMEKEEVMLTIMFAMLGIITVFVTLVVFYMIINHKSKDIGILKSFGVGAAGIVEIFVYFATFVGVTGASIGTAAGCLFLLKVNVLEDWLYVKFGWQLWDRNVFAIGDIPNQVRLDLLAVIFLSAVAACIVGVLVPSIQAAMKQPAEVLQVNEV